MKPQRHYTNATAIGNGAISGHSNAICIGDFTRSYKPGQVEIGEELFGEEIPEKVREMLVEYPDEAMWFLERVLKVVVGT